MFFYVKRMLLCCILYNRTMDLSHLYVTMLYYIDSVDSLGKLLLYRSGFDIVLIVSTTALVLLSHKDYRKERFYAFVYFYLTFLFSKALTNLTMFSYTGVCVCVRACVRAGVRACVRACVRVFMHL